MTYTIEPGTLVRVIIQGPAEILEDGRIAVTTSRYVHTISTDDPSVQVLELEEA